MVSNKNSDNKNVKVVERDDLQVYVIHDTVAGIYTRPIIQVNEMLMKRYFNQLVTNPQNLTQPEEFKLFHLGSYNDSTGEFKLFKDRKFIMYGFREDKQGETNE